MHNESVDKCVNYVNPLLCFVYIHMIKEQQTKVINIKCYHDNLHACKDINHEYPKSSFFYATCRSAISWVFPVTQSMYFRLKDAHFQLHKFGLLISFLHEECDGLIFSVYAVKNNGKFSYYVLGNFS